MFQVAKTMAIRKYSNLPLGRQELENKKIDKNQFAKFTEERKLR